MTFAACVPDAMAIQNRMVPLHDALFSETSPGPVKYAASLLGHTSEKCRLPLAPCGDATKARTELGWTPSVNFKQLIEMMVAEGNRRRLLTARRTLKSVDRVLATLKAQLEEIDHDIDIAVRAIEK